jgi:hypothetical protein
MPELPSPLIDILSAESFAAFSRNVVLGELLFSLNVVPKPWMLSVRTVYVLSSLQLRGVLQSSVMPVTGLRANRQN